MSLDNLHLSPREYFTSRAFLEDGFATCTAALFPQIREVITTFHGCGAADFDEETRTAKVCMRPQGTCEGDKHGFYIGQVHHVAMFVHDAVECLRAQLEAIGIREDMGMNHDGLTNPDWTKYPDPGTGRDLLAT